MPSLDISEGTRPPRILLEEDWGEELSFGRTRSEAELVEDEPADGRRCREEPEWLFA